MRTLRQNRIDRALARVLGSIGDYLLPDATLRTEVALHVVPPPTTAEMDEAIRHADTQRRIIGIQGETGPKWKLSEVGQAWHAENP